MRYVQTGMRRRRVNEKLQGAAAELGTHSGYSWFGSSVVPTLLRYFVSWEHACGLPPFQGAVRKASEQSDRRAARFLGSSACHDTTTPN